MNKGYQTSNQVPINNMYGYYIPYNYSNGKNSNDERLAGGFIFPFLLGGVTGAAVAPAFWNNGYGYNNRPNYYYYQPGPYYPYPPRRWF